LSCVNGGRGCDDFGKEGIIALLTSVPATSARWQHPFFFSPFSRNNQEF